MYLLIVFTGKQHMWEIINNKCLLAIITFNTFTHSAGAIANLLRKNKENRWLLHNMLASSSCWLAQLFNFPAQAKLFLIMHSQLKTQMCISVNVIYISFLFCTHTHTRSLHNVWYGYFFYATQLENKVQ